jgi:hypothetical protein
MNRGAAVTGPQLPMFKARRQIRGEGPHLTHVSLPTSSALPNPHRLHPRTNLVGALPLQPLPSLNPAWPSSTFKSDNFSRVLAETAVKSLSGGGGRTSLPSSSQGLSFSVQDHSICTSTDTCTLKQEGCAGLQPSHRYVAPYQPTW